MQTFEDYQREVEEKAERAAREEETCRREDHLRAFNLGRMVQRTEKSRCDVWLRIGFLLAGVAVGVACGKVYPDSFYSALAQRFLTKASRFVRGEGKARLWRF